MLYSSESHRSVRGVLTKKPEEWSGCQPLAELRLALLTLYVQMNMKNNDHRSLIKVIQDLIVVSHHVSI